MKGGLASSFIMPVDVGNGEGLQNKVTRVTFRHSSLSHHGEVCQHHGSALAGVSMKMGVAQHEPDQDTHQPDTENGDQGKFGHLRQLGLCDLCCTKGLFD